MDYYAKVEPIIDGVKFHSSKLEVSIFDDNDKRIGGYVRDYHSIHNTFHTFKQDNEWYALYSRNQLETSIMKLPSCEHLFTIDSKFSPVEYYVPRLDNLSLCSRPEDIDKLKPVEGTFGFIAGCYWGDDDSWKVGYLDLSDIKNKNASIDFRFGYIKKPSLPLYQSIDFSEFEPDENSRIVKIMRTHRYNLNEHHVAGDSELVIKEVFSESKAETPLYQGIDLQTLSKDDLIKIILSDCKNT